MLKLKFREMKVLRKAVLALLFAGAMFIGKEGHGLSGGAGNGFSSDSVIAGLAFRDEKEGFTTQLEKVMFGKGGGNGLYSHNFGKGRGGLALGGDKDGFAQPRLGGGVGNG